MSICQLAHSGAEPLIVAHRGASFEAPENTLSAFQLAWSQNADAIEVDVHLTKDGEIVCIHDSNTSRTANRSLSVSRNRLLKLRELDAGSWKGDEYAGEKIPTLAEALASVPAGKKIFIELKASFKIVDPLLQELDASKLSEEQIVIIAFNARTIAQLKRQLPSLTINLLSGIHRRSKGTALEPSSKTLLAKLRRCHADGLGVYAHPDLPLAFVEEIQEAGFPIHVWTVDDPEIARSWADRGAVSITTNKPEFIRAAISDR